MESFWERSKRQSGVMPWQRERTQVNPLIALQRQREARAARERSERARGLSQTRAQAEARVAQPNANERAQARLREEFPADPLFGQSGTGRVRSYTPEEQAANRRALEEFVFGPQRPSVVNVGQPASRPERLARDWFLSEQEFRTAAERVREGELLPAAGWAGLGLAGVVPVAGDAVQALARGGRAAEAAADVARAGAGRNISQEFGQEVASGSVRYTADPVLLETTRPHRRNAIEAIHRQGFDQPPSVVDRASFENLAQSGDYIPIYRGVSGTSNVPASEFVEQFADGKFFVGGGSAGAGAYFSKTPEGAMSYSGLTEFGGDTIEALVPRSARIFDMDGPGAELMRQQWKASPFVDMGEFLIANGYDGLSIGNDFILYNRSAAIVPRR